MVTFSQSTEVVSRIENGEEPILVIRHPLLKHLNRCTVFRWIQQGKLPSIRLGRQFFSTGTIIREALLAGDLREVGHKPTKTNHSDHEQAVARLEARFKARAGKSPRSKAVQ